MPIPDYQTVMLPLLKFASDNEEHSLNDAIKHIVAEFKLTREEENELLPKGRQKVIYSRVSWASVYLRKAGLLESIKRGFFQITSKGQKALKLNPSSINNQFLKQFPEFRGFLAIQRKNLNQAADTVPENETAKTPLEMIEYGYQALRDDLAKDVLKQVRQSSPKFFENLVVELLLKMGYGGSFKEAGKTIGQTGDEGIDGIIKEDKLGLDVIYIQAKRWDTPVGRPELNKFVGALAGQGARKGVFITTSQFTKDAVDYAETIRPGQQKIILIDGEMLAQFLIENDIGVSKVIAYDVKRVDSDYFSET